MTIELGTKLTFKTLHKHLFYGMDTFPGIVDKVNEDGSLNLHVEVKSDQIRYIQNVMPVDEGEDHFWYELS